MASAAESSIDSTVLEIVAQGQDIIAKAIQPNSDAYASSQDASAVVEESPTGTSQQRQQAPHPPTKESSHDSIARGSIVQESAQQLTPKSSPSQRKEFRVPHLPTAKSMPAPNIQAMEDGGSANLHARLTKSFGDVESPGDTQEMPSQEVLTAYNVSMRFEQVTPLKESMLGTYPDKSNTPGTYQDETQATNRTPRTQKEGEPGYVNLAGYQGSSPNPDDFLRDETQAASQPMGPPNGFMTPAPPRRENSDQLPTSGAIAKTPGFTQAFDFPEPADVMTGTQMFNQQTQQPSSPFPHPPQSDPITTRPEYPSSPLRAGSSPLVTMKRPASAASEPRDKYISKEEENRRKAEIAKQRELERLASGDIVASDEDEDDTQDRKFRAHMRRQRSGSDVLERINAPARRGSRPDSARKARSNDVINIDDTPVTARKQPWDDDFIQDPETIDDGIEEQDLPGEAAEHVQYSERDIPDADTDDGQPEAAEDDEFEHENGSVNDEYDEHSGLLMSQRDPDIDFDNNSISGSAVHDDDVQMKDDEEEMKPQVDQQDEANISHEHVLRSTLRSTVADSQPEQEEPAPVQQVVQSSNNISFVPGSQYNGQTSQGLAGSRSQPPTNSGSRIAASQPLGADDRISSSPPVPRAASTIPEDSAEASLLRQNMLGQFQMQTESTDDEPTNQPEVPESDVPDILPSRPQTAQSLEQSESLPAPFSTARTHVSASAQSPAKASTTQSPMKAAQSQQSRLTDPSPRKAAGVRHFSEFAKGPIATNPSFESQNINDDIDDIMNGVYTEEDRVLERHVASPDRPRKKRPKLSHKPSGFISSSFARPPSMNESNLDIDQPQPDENGNTMHNDEEQTPRPVKPEPTSETRIEDEMDVDSARPGDAPRTIVESEADAPSPLPALRESPSKANKLPTPTIQSSSKVKTRQDTSESVREREEAGRAAVSQLVSTRSTASAKRSKPATYGRTSREKLSAKISKTKSRRHSVKAPTPEGSEPEDEVQLEDRAAENVHNQTRVDLLPLPEDAVVAQVEEGATETVAPERVFALFKGTPQNFYPAVYLGGSADGMTYKIRFDDRTVTCIDTQHVRRLELCVGDVVKIDDPKMRKKNWRVTGFGAIATTQDESDLGTDVFGHTTIKVQVSHQRTSIARPSSTPADNDEEKEVLVNAVYITPTMWPQYKGRTFTPLATGKSNIKRAETPSTRSNTPATETSASRSRRAPVACAKVKSSGSRPSHLRETSLAPSSAGQSSAIFSEMAFAISYTQDTPEKAEVTRLIKRHGGIILELGFEELFELSNLDGTANISPSRKGSPKKQIPATGLQLKDKYSSLRFAACISDKHSRRAKYIQALALGLPTISGRWILHCLDETRNATLSGGEVTTILWDKYLLPAGESTFLGGSVRSRTLTPYAANDADLATTVADRANLLNGEGLLIVAPKKSSYASEEKRKTFGFLTLALGAGQVKRVQDFATAKNLLAEDEGTWKWVYADGTIFEDGKAEMFDGTGKANAGAAGAGKKRKRTTNQVVSESTMFATDGTVKLVNDEFVIQSLILGALAED